MGKSKNKGGGNGNSKLTASEVWAIFLSKLPQRELAEQYGISQPHVSRIKNRDHWVFRI